MTDKTPQFVALTAHVLDERRVTLRLKTENLPPLPNVQLSFANPADMPDPAPNFFDESHLPAHIKTGPNQALLDSPFPNVELSIHTASGQEVASAFIVEHQEPLVEMTLYLPQAQTNAAYIARAKMLQQNSLLARLETPFTLHPPLSHEA
jgi:hypothetical protein